MDQLFILQTPSAAAARSATSAPAGIGRDGSRFGAALRDAINEPRGGTRSGGPADRAAERAAAGADHPGSARATEARDGAAAARDARREPATVDGGRDTDGEAAHHVRRPGPWALGQLARDLIAQLETGSLASHVGSQTGVDGSLLEDAAATGLVDEAEALLADLAVTPDTSGGELEVALGSALEDLVAALDTVDLVADGTTEVGDGLPADAEASTPVPVDATVAVDAEEPTTGDVEVEEGKPAGPVATATADAAAVSDGAAPTVDVPAGAAEVTSEETVGNARRRGPADAASPRAAERAGERGPSEPVRANEAGPPRSPRAEERAAEPRVMGSTSRTEATLTDEARVASTSTEGLRSTDAPRAEAVRQTTLPSSVQRVLDLVAQMEKMPPPRQLVLELGDLRVRVGMEDGQVRLTVLAGDQRDADDLLADARDALAEQGFDLAGDGSDAADAEADDAQAVPGDRPGSRPVDRASERAADRARAHARAAGLRL